MKAMTYYDFLSPSEKMDLRSIMVSGPQLAYEGVSPNATDAERLAIGNKRYADKFDRSPFDCPLNSYVDGVEYDTRTISQRLENND